ncbi:copper transporter [Halorussus sp. AFM4]|uniref:copper transporter n=1 Tax=Halorussus sp. AFM4 TaxID=3421651 RepID=UPI003EC09AF0
MGPGWDHQSLVSSTRMFYLFGTIYILAAIGRAFYVVTSSEALLTGIIDFLFVGGPGFVLLYGGYRLPQTDIHPKTYSRISLWCLGGFGVTLVLVELLRLEPGVIFRYPRWALTLSTSLGTASGFLIGVYDARGITRAAQLRNQRQQLQQQQQQLHQQSQKLQRQNARLENFASLLAHELRNPLSTAKIYLRQVSEGDQTAVEEVDTALTRIEEMVEVILVIARGEDADIDREEVTLASVAEDTWADLEVPTADLVVETDQTLLVDPVHLQHLLENLFTNAVEHADGSVTIRIGDLPSGFYVEDTGPGIPEEDRDRIFDAGYTTGGIGFGLMFVAELAEAYGWNYMVSESADGGARFEFTDIDSTNPKKTHMH